tara:strand:+ start:10006 stop:10968 length:963 start_codon:yes stop_codon:yes gene_type:complete
MYKLNRKLNIVLVGTGKAGNYHAKVLNSIKNVKISGVVNSGKEDPVHFRKKYGIPIWIKNIKDITSNKDIDAFIVASSHNVTLEVVKHISGLAVPCLIEKPLGTSLSESEEILSFLSDQKLIFVGYNRRFYSCILVAQNYIKKLGEPISMHIDAPEPLCSLIERDKDIKEISNRLILNTTHALDIMTLIFGNYTKVTNFSHNSSRNGLKIDFMSFIEFKSNRTASFLSHWASPGNWYVKIFGEDYQISLNLNRNVAEINSKELGDLVLPEDGDDKNFKSGVLKQNYYFLRSVEENKQMHENLCKPDEGYLNIKLAEELKR